MNPDDLIHRLHEVIDTALSDSLTVENDRAAGRAEVEACEAERREAEAVRDEVTAALRRLADPVTLGELAWDAVHAHGAFARDFPDETYYRAVGEAIARGETNEGESNA